MKTRRPTAAKIKSPARRPGSARRNPSADDRDYHAEIGRKIRDTRSSMMDQIASLRDDVHDLDTAWKEWDIDYLERRRYITKAEAGHLRRAYGL
jgi:hypothetical protein